MPRSLSLSKKTVDFHRGKIRQKLFLLATSCNY
ncbi:MAG: hypothetical protein ACUVTO_05690 [Candidatus Caldatribacteriaceae bacterium]